ncbi:MAG TPA: response regulator, partial [Thermoanaerobaculia bacterium]|nr:response regulator [Thermoanaerobaculia bacterium]
LGQEFSVVLLDVNMPGMDGFETAALIRQRKISEHTPIIFITAFSDDTHVARGYSLGAVDYIVAPVVPEVLKSKVGVFIDLFRQAEQIRTQAESLRARAEQLHRLTRASLAINAALSLEAMLRVVAERARELLGAREAVAISLADDAGVRTRAFAATEEGTEELSAETCDAWYGAAPRSPGFAAIVADADRRRLSAPLTRRDGSDLGWIHVVGAPGATLTPDDEALLVPLAQMAAIAIENSLSSELREANRLKDEFLTTLSHELRTPLSAVLGWTRLLRESRHDLDRLEHGLEVIERNALSQARMVEDLLDISRIALGKLRFAQRTIELTPLVQTSVEAMRPAALAKRLSLRFRADPAIGPGMVSGDPDRLQQVFRNLLSNALKFTDGGGHVEVSLTQEADQFVVAVRDDGIGISPAFLGVVFERFRQADASTSRWHSGLGIGLSIVRHILDAHGGTVSAESAGPGLGATFTVRLPVARPAESATDEIAAEAGPARSRLVGVRILLVDDDLDGREAIHEALSAYGAEVTLAESMAEALSRLEPIHDVLISDIGMPGGDGYELLTRVRGLLPESGGAIPAIALTAYARPDDRRKALEAGFNAHVPKPVDPASLVATVHALARRSSGTGTTADSQARPSSPRILVVEDDLDTLEGIRLLLEMSGYIVDVAETGREAIEKVRRNGADVALLDSRLPDMPGHEVAEALRRERAPRPILLVAISGLSPLESEAGASTFDAWLSKPFDVSRLSAILEARARP